MNNDNNLQSLKDVLTKNDRIGILVGKNPSIDEMGAALALYLSLKQNGKSVVIACPTEPIVEISSLVGINSVKSELSGEGGDLIVSFPYKEGEIEKVSYTLDNGYLNIVVKAGSNGISFDEKDVKYKREGNLPNLLFIVGTPRLSDLGSLFNPEVLKDTTIVNIDNKSDNQGFGDVVLVSPRFSSVSEQVANVINSFGFEMDIDIAQNLLSGISFATNNFQDQKTSITAFEMAAILMKKGAVRQKNVQPKNFLDENQFLNPFMTNPRDIRVSEQQNKQSQIRNSFRNPQPFPRHQQQNSSYQQNQQNAGVNRQTQQNQKGTKDEDETPADWLTPKVYKGSTSIE